MLKDRYDLDLLAHPISVDNLMNVYEHYLEKRDVMRQVLGESVSQHSADYSKAYLISEAAFMILREIAPRRLKKKKKGN